MTRQQIGYSNHQQLVAHREWRVTGIPFHRHSQSKGYPMTIKAELSAIEPTEAARQAFKEFGSDLDVLLTQVQGHVTDLQRIVKQVIAFHPTSSDADASNYAALQDVLDQLD
jgi:hypothetical protein